MRFPYKAYADMTAREEKSASRQVANSVAGEKKAISESALENEDDVVETEHDDTDDVSGSEDNNLVD